MWLDIAQGCACSRPGISGSGPLVRSGLTSSSAATDPLADLVRQLTGTQAKTALGCAGRAARERPRSILELGRGRPRTDRRPVVLLARPCPRAEDRRVRVHRARVAEHPARGVSEFATLVQDRL